MIYNNLADNQEQQFEKYKDLLLEWNQKFNLTAITNPQDIQKKHFEDSLLFAEAIKFGGFNLNEISYRLSLADVGSGGGFPGIPLKIAYPNLEVTLIEATGKKCLFLKEVIKQLNLTEINVVNTRAEDLVRNPNFRGRFDIITARAVSSLDNLTKWTRPLLKSKGVLITEKGVKELPIIEKFAGKIEKIDPIIEKLEIDDKVLVIIKNK